MFDAIVVYSSFLMLILEINANSLGVLRVMRIFKIVIEMKKVADHKKRIQDSIKLHNRQGSQSVSANVRKDESDCLIDRKNF